MYMSAEKIPDIFGQMKNKWAKNNDYTWLTSSRGVSHSAPWPRFWTRSRGITSGRIILPFRLSYFYLPMGYTHMSDSVSGLFNHTPHAALVLPLVSRLRLACISCALPTNLAPAYPTHADIATYECVNSACFLVSGDGVWPMSVKVFNTGELHFV